MADSDSLLADEGLLEADRLLAELCAGLNVQASSEGATEKKTGVSDASKLQDEERFADGELEAFDFLARALKDNTSLATRLQACATTVHCVTSTSPADCSPPNTMLTIVGALLPTDVEAAVPLLDKVRRIAPRARVLAGVVYASQCPAPPRVLRSVRTLKEAHALRLSRWLDPLDPLDPLAAPDPPPFSLIDAHLARVLLVRHASSVLQIDNRPRELVWRVVHVPGHGPTPFPDVPSSPPPIPPARIESETDGVRWSCLPWAAMDESQRRRTLASAQTLLASPQDLLSSTSALLVLEVSAIHEAWCGGEGEETVECLRVRGHVGRSRLIECLRLIHRLMSRIADLVVEVGVIPEPKSSDEHRRLRLGVPEGGVSLHCSRCGGSLRDAASVASGSPCRAFTPVHPDPPDEQGCVWFCETCVDVAGGADQQHWEPPSLLFEVRGAEEGEFGHHPRSSLRWAPACVRRPLPGSANAGLRAPAAAAGGVSSPRVSHMPGFICSSCGNGRCVGPVWRCACCEAYTECDQCHASHGWPRPDEHSCCAFIRVGGFGGGSLWMFPTIDELVPSELTTPPPSVSRNEGGKPMGQAADQTLGEKQPRAEAREALLTSLVTCPGRDAKLRWSRWMQRFWENQAARGLPKSVPDATMAMAVPRPSVTTPQVLSASNPRVLRVPNFLSDAECDHLIRLGMAQVGFGTTSRTSTILPFLLSGM